MALYIKSGTEMSVKELKLSEELYKRYYEGERKRIPRFSFRFQMNFDSSRLDEQLKKAKEIINCANRMIVYHGGVNAGRTALMLALLKDLQKHGVAISTAQQRLGSIEQTHIPYDSFWKTEFNSAMLKDLDEISVRLPEKVQNELLDEPENWLAPEPPKRKKFRANQPDKRALNRKNRKRK